jgi:hypothetical protein
MPLDRLPIVNIEGDDILCGIPLDSFWFVVVPVLHSFVVIWGSARNVRILCIAGACKTRNFERLKAMKRNMSHTDNDARGWYTTAASIERAEHFRAADKLLREPSKLQRVL